MVYFYLTEAEAKVKVCPQLSEAGSACTVDRIGCMGALCMAWRWAKEKDTRMIDEECTYVDVGYCGLAGKP